MHQKNPAQAQQKPRIKPTQPEKKRGLLLVTMLWLLIASGSILAKAQADKAGQWELSLKGKPVQGALLYGTAPQGAKVFANDQKLPVTEGGHFLLGIGRFDTAPVTLRIETSAQSYSLVVPVIQREFPTEVVNGLPPKKVNPPKEVLQRIRQEGALIARARGVVEPREDFLVPFQWPAQGRVSGVYGSRRILNGEPKRPHYGMDIANKAGTPVIAPAPGVVRLAEPDLYYSGGTIIIDHGLGLTSTYLHLSAIDVTPGQRVEQGQKIGEIGSTGRATGPHLDWRVNLGKKRLDPQLLLN